MSEHVQVLRLSHTHEAIMNWMLVNPGCSLRECADHFQITQSWLSSLIHSDIFQAQLAERQEGIRVRIADSIPQKLRVAADLGLDKLTRVIEETEDAELILDATDKLLHRLGYAPQKTVAPPPFGGSGNTQNNFFVTAGELEKARELMGRVGEANPAATIEGEVVSREADTRG